MDSHRETPSAPPLLEPTLARVQTACLIVLAICAAGFALAHLVHIVSPLLIAVFLFHLIIPLTKLLARWRIPLWLSSLLFLTLVLAGTGLLVQLTYGNVKRLEERLPELQRRFETTVRATIRFAEFGTTRPPASDPATVAEQSVLLTDVLHVNWRQIIEFVFGTAMGFVETSLMVLFYMVFIFIESQKLPARIRQAFPPDESARYLTIGEGIAQSIERFLTYKTYISLGLGATTGLIGYLFGVEFWLLWAGLMFLANYITYIGSMVALIPPIVLAFVLFSSPWGAVVLTILLVLNRLIWIDYLEIRFLGRQLNISPLVLLLSIAFFGLLWGMVGMLIAVPLVTVIKIILSHFEATRPYALLISEE